ncbi:MAG: LUD domain-containing protein [Thermoleophilia bacterium]
MSDLVERFVANATRNGLIVHRGGIPPELAGAVASRAAYALADPGSVVVVASPEEPRTRSLLPYVHVAVVAEDRILPDLATLLVTVRGALPSSMAVITGPSRSADIENTLTLGVHGPGEQHVAIVPPGA